LADVTTAPISLRQDWKHTDGKAHMRLADSWNGLENVTQIAQLVWDTNTLAWVRATQAGGGTGGAGDASAANQTTEIAKLEAIRLAVTSALAVTGPATDVQLRAAPLPVSGTVTANTGLAQPLTDNRCAAPRDRGAHLGGCAPTARGRGDGCGTPLDLQRAAAQGAADRHAAGECGATQHGAGRRRHERHRPDGAGARRRYAAVPHAGQRLPALALERRAAPRHLAPSTADTDFWSTRSTSRSSTSIAFTSPAVSFF
jgi:hypothetical protein